MCLFIDQGVHKKKKFLSPRPKPFKAQEDIRCYKYFWMLHGNRFESINYNMQWEGGKVYKQRMMSDHGIPSVIGAGLHAKQVRPEDDYIQFAAGNEKRSVAECIVYIPKGAKYYLGEGNEDIVANKMYISSVTRIFTPEE
jgi:hypothetical protein